MNFASQYVPKHVYMYPRPCGAGSAVAFNYVKGRYYAGTLLFPCLVYVCLCLECRTTSTSLSFETIQIRRW